MLPTELQILEKPLGWVNLEPGWAALGRIALWAAVFLLVAKWLLDGFAPAPVSQADPGEEGLTSMLVRSNDPLWVNKEPKQFPDNGLLNVAWISGSAGKLISDPPVHIASFTLDALEKQQQVQAEAFIYYMEAARLLDALVATQDAIRREPDVLVIELDPLWIYNSLQVYRGRNVFNGAATLWWNTRDWPKQLLFVAPRNHWWAWIGNYLPRASLERLPKLLESFISRPDKPQRAEGNRQPMQGVQFWAMQRDFAGVPRATAGDIGSINAWQSKMLLFADTQPDTWASSNAWSLFEAVRASAIPAVIFVAPVSAEIRKDPNTSEAYYRVLDALRELKARYESNSIRIITELAPEVEQSIDHYDRIHMHDPGALPALLAEKIAAVGGEH